ncbi:MAG: hypothetical protein ACT4OU_10195 [Hyphomicrobium sp.]
MEEKSVNRSPALRHAGVVAQTRRFGKAIGAAAAIFTTFCGWKAGGLGAAGLSCDGAPAIVGMRALDDVVVMDGAKIGEAAGRSAGTGERDFGRADPAVAKLIGTGRRV